MDILTNALRALSQVLVVGIVLGVGLPALFAVGIRALNTNRTVIPAAASHRNSDKPRPAAIATAGICFGLCLLAVLFGITVILFGKRMFAV
ncbi:MAG: hypothetical protein K0S98_2299 [Propionibacteriaceae bacterium]|nr:hypothetical protein [Propionibacteriaceae bacterium]